MQFIKDENRMMLLIEGKACMNCMDKIIHPNTVDAAKEKHLPMVEFEGDTLKVNVGSVEHPMNEEHYIAWIFVETKDGGMYKKLSSLGKPFASFKVDKEEVVAVYEYCNLHGLWKIEV